jgi:hypothetical protein
VRGALVVLACAAFLAHPASASAATLRFAGELGPVLDEAGFFAGHAVESGARVLAELRFDPSSAPLALRPDGFGGDIVELAATLSLSIGGETWLDGAPVVATAGRVYGIGFPGQPATPMESTSFLLRAALGTLPSGRPVEASLSLATPIPLGDPLRLPPALSPGAAIQLHLLGTRVDPEYCGFPAPWAGCTQQRPIVAATGSLAAVGEPSAAAFVAAALALAASRRRPARRAV